MKRYEAVKIIEDVFEHKFNSEQYKYFIKNLLKNPEENHFQRTGYNIFRGFEDFIASYERFYKFEDLEGNEIDVLAVKLKREFSIYHARSKQRNFVKKYLVNKERDAALVAFYSDSSDEWRFSFIKMQYSLATRKDELTPAKRYSFLVGEKGKTHTAKKQIIPILQNDNTPSMNNLEETFNVEVVSDEFFEKYKELVFRLKDKIEIELSKNQKAEDEFKNKEITIMEFAKKLLGQIVFIYFLQKKGWLGCTQEQDYGNGDRNFLRTLFENKKTDQNFYSEYLEFLFYEALSEKRVTDFYQRFECKIPFLNGGLFDPINFYDWQNIKLVLPNELFSNNVETKEGDIGNGILDIFDRYNFTVKEDEPLEKEVAVDPEMLGKAFERMIDKDERKWKGAFYTPREIVHYIAQESIINYLNNMLNEDSKGYEILTDDQLDFFGNKGKKGQLNLTSPINEKKTVSKEDIDYFIHYGENIKEIDQALSKGSLTDENRNPSIPEPIMNNADIIDILLCDIRVCDPAVGSGAFPVGIMNEIVKARDLLSPHITNEKLKQKRDAYHFKLNAIDNSLYGVDIDKSAVDICKLRLWLSLVVDEDRIETIDPLPNLEYKIVGGNSLVGFPTQISGFEFRTEGMNQIEIMKDKYKHETDREIKKQKLYEINSKISAYYKSGKYKIDFDYRINFSEVYKEKKGFDIVIGNPPYVGEKGNKEIFQPIKKAPLGIRFYKGKMDLFYFFFHLGFDILNEKGVLGFITTNYFITATGGINLRNDIKKRTDILSITNFNELRIFKSATGQHNQITILTKNRRNHIAKNCITSRRGIATSETIEKIISGFDEDTDYYQMNQSELFYNQNNYIRTGINKVDEILDKMLINSSPLGEVCDVNTGIMGGCDYINKRNFKYATLEFIKDNDICLKDGVFVLDSMNDRDSSILEVLTDNEYLKPFYKNSDISRFVTNKLTTKKIIFSSKENGAYNNKLIKQHLDRFKNILVKIREINNEEKTHFPYLRRGTAHPHIFNSPKIVTPQRSSTNTFGYNDISWYASADVYYITKRDNDVNLKFVLGLLNSKLFFTWLYNRGKRKGEYLELYQKPLSEIPIPKVPEKKQKPFEKLVIMILFCKEKETELGINPLYSAYFEQVIDGMVFELYFEEEMKSADRDIMQHLGDLQELTEDMNDTRKLEIVKATFNRLYDKEHPVRKNLFLMDSIEEIRIIKGLDK